MATRFNNTPPQQVRDQLNTAATESCYIQTLLSVLEDIFEGIDDLCDDEALGSLRLGYVKSKASIGLQITYMAQDKLSIAKNATNEAEEALFMPRAN